jgi:hypothetical protein
MRLFFDDRSSPPLHSTISTRSSITTVTGAMSADGIRRSKHRTMSLLKFSSDRKRITARPLALSEQADGARMPSGGWRL